jgi:hypothetical protein
MLITRYILLVLMLMLFCGACKSKFPKESAPIEGLYAATNWKGTNHQCYEEIEIFKTSSLKNNTKNFECTYKHIIKYKNKMVACDKGGVIVKNGMELIFDGADTGDHDVRYAENPEKPERMGAGFATRRSNGYILQMGLDMYLLERVIIK